MGKSFRVLDNLKAIRLETVVVANDKEPTKFLGCAHIVHTRRLCIHDQLLSHLSETISQEWVDVIKLVLCTLFNVFEATLSSRNSILVNQTVSQIAECVVQDDWRSYIFRLSDLSSSSSIKSLDCILLEMWALSSDFEICHSSDFDFGSLINFIRRAHG